MTILKFLTVSVPIHFHLMRASTVLTHVPATPLIGDDADASDMLEMQQASHQEKLEWEVSKGEYLEFNMNLQHHVTVHVNGEKIFDQQKALDVAMIEWEFDCRGHEAMTYTAFWGSLFQLADAWAGKVHVIGCSVIFVAINWEPLLTNR